jgi:NAD(P)-dependent dehydrogenase (short-subunit alcohol dehydrogenase family)
MGRLSGKVAIVTGGSQGVGLGIARTFLGEGASVLITGRDADKLAVAAAGLSGLGGEIDSHAATVGIRADAEATIAKVVERFGRLDILVNNAQTSKPGTPLEETDDETIELTIRSGLYGTIHHMQAAFPHMKETGGSVVNLGSREGIFGGVGFAAYAATKEAIRGLSRTAAREWGKHRIRVNVICPAALSPIAIKYLAEHKAEAEMYLQQIALGYFGDPQGDIGPVALFLASDDSRYITGQTINADGGQMML